MVKYVVFCKQGHIVTLSPDRIVSSIGRSPCFCGEPELRGLVDWLDIDCLVPPEPVDEGERTIEVDGRAFVIGVPIFDVRHLFHAEEEQY